MHRTNGVTFTGTHPDLLRCWGIIPGSQVGSQCENRVDPSDLLGLCGRCVEWKRDCQGDNR